jgi:16S rRNA (guanine(527)-N(7))-methyltransferase RsmG
MQQLRDDFRTDLDRIRLHSVAASKDMVDRLLEYATLLQRWNAKIRLVGPLDLPTIVREQLVDALGFALAVADLDISSYWDIGAGGGLPGLPLAIVFDDREFTLVEPIHKKTAFLAHAVTNLGLANVRVHTGRVESDGTVAPPLRLPPRHAPTGALSRATLGPSEWFETAKALLPPGGTALIAVADESSLPPDLIDDPSTRAAGTWRWTIPATSAPRTLIARTL